MTKFAAIQMASSPHVRSNFLEADRLIKDAAEQGAELVVLPENFALMGEEFDKLEYMEDDLEPGPIQEFLAKAANKYSVWVIGGTIPMVSDDPKKILAACLVYNEQGERVGRYDKMHLFDVSVPDSDEDYRESSSIQPGHQELVVDSPFGMLGLAICYDLRFPELFRKLLGHGAEILITPSAFTAQTGAAHWEVLLRARAIENLCYVVAPNQGGFHLNGRQTYGHSMIIDPWGTVINRLDKGAGAVVAEIDLERVEQVRKTFPAIEHRRIF
ncbi:MAG: carbon-nitrogen hydrolase family protein [Methylococcaceae bacterium]